MSRASIVLGVTLLLSTAGCIHPHSRHGSRYGTHGSVYVGWRHRTPPPVVHHHGHGCGHVQVGLEWVVSVPVTRHGSVTPAPTSGRHDRGLHRGHDVAPPHVEYSSPSRVEHSEGAVVHEVVSVLHESVEQPEVVHEHDGHPGRGKSPDKAKATGHEKAKGKGHEKAKATGHEKAKGKGHDEAKGKGHDEAKGKGNEKAKGKGDEKQDD